MIVCHCKGVSDRSIRQAVRAGARSSRQVVRACGAGSRCGGCRPMIEEIIDREHSRLPTLTVVDGLTAAS